MGRPSLSCIALLLLGLAAPALASVAEGERKWRKGDFAGAVADWRAPAAAGDPEAMFNMGQAYRLGRGVSQNLDIAIDFYRRASARGLVAATANLGISLFQDGRKAESLGFLRTAADSGDARAALVLGLATFSGDGAPRNPALGLAYVMRARDLGLAPAAPQVSRLSALLTETDRARAQAAAAALADGRPVSVTFVAAPGPATQTPAPPAGPMGEDESEAEATPAARNASRAAEPAETAAAAAPVGRGFVVQLGAYSNEPAARVAWATLVSQSADLLAGRSPIYAPGGRLVRLQIGPFAAKTEAQALCAQLSAVGRPCFVTAG
jgi:cell division septation protein DedD